MTQKYIVDILDSSYWSKNVARILKKAYLVFWFNISNSLRTCCIKFNMYRLSLNSFYYLFQNLVEDIPPDTPTQWTAYAPDFGPVLTGSLSRRVALWVIGLNQAADVLPTQRVWPPVPQDKAPSLTNYRVL